MTLKTAKVKLPNLSGLYQVQKNDAHQAISMLGESFRKDPIWSEILKDSPDSFPYAFEMPIKYSIKYGRVYASSQNIEGVAAWLGSPYMNINFWRVIRSGAMNFKLNMKVLKLIQQVFSIIEKDRKKLMEQPYVYLIVLGVSPNHQSQGIGSKLVRSMLNTLPTDIPVYLETESEKNVRFYEKLGFEVVNTVTVPILELPMWEMLYKQ